MNKFISGLLIGAIFIMAPTLFLKVVAALAAILLIATTFGKIYLDAQDARKYREKDNA